MGIKKSKLGQAVGQTPAPLDLSEQSAPTLLANKSRLYAKDVSGISEFFVRDDAGNEVQITSGGSLPSGGGGMPFVIVGGGTPGSYTVTLDSVNVCLGSGYTLTLPASPTADDRFGIIAFDSVILDGTPNLVVDPVYFANSGATVTLASLDGYYYYYEFQWLDSGAPGWYATGKGYYGVLLEFQDEGTAYGYYARTLNVTGAGISLSVCGGAVEITVPGAVAGGFPPIATYGIVSGTATAGCSYIQTCSCGGSLTLPDSPSDGNEVGFYRTCGNIIVYGNGKYITTPTCNCTIIAFSNTEAGILRYSNARDRWEPVMGPL